MHREGEADPEELLLTPGKARRQVLGIDGGHVDPGVCEAPPGGVGAPGGLKAGELAAQALGGHGRWHGLDVQRDIEAPGVGGQRLQPAEADLPRVAGDSEAGAPLLAEAERPRAGLDSVGPERGSRTARGVRQEAA